MKSKWKGPLAILIFGLVFSPPALFSGEVNIKAIPVAKQIYMLTGKGGNIGLFIGDDGTFLIDDQFAPLTEKIVAAVKSVGGQFPKFLINTHYHYTGVY